MEKSTGFEDLVVWQKAHSFVLNVYRQTKLFPKEELFGLVSQYRRAAVSIAANIAEGYGKRSSHDKLRFYNIAEGSANECRYYAILSGDLGFVEPDASKNMLVLLTDVHRLLKSYMQTIREHPF
jgi:four helix bundle protein